MVRYTLSYPPLSRRAVLRRMIFFFQGSHQIYRSRQDEEWRKNERKFRKNDMENIHNKVHQAQRDIVELFKDQLCLQWEIQLLSQLSKYSGGQLSPFTKFLGVAKYVCFALTQENWRKVLFDGYVTWPIVECRKRILLSGKFSGISRKADIDHYQNICLAATNSK